MTQNKMKPQRKNTNVRYNRIKTRMIYGVLSLGWSLSARRTGRFLETQFFTPGRRSPSAKEAKVLRAGEPFQLRIHGKTVQAWRWGSGAGILFVHGWNGRGGQFHHFITSVVNNGYRAIAFDAPAHGASGGITTNGFEFYDTVNKLLEPAHGLNIHGIVGHSLGAAAVVYALSALSIHPRTVLLAPALKLAAILERGFVERGIPPVVHKGVIGKLEQRYGYDLTRDDPHLLLPRILAETLVVHDRLDTTIPYEDSRFIVAQNHHIRLHTTEGLGHSRLLSDGAVATSVLDHLFPKKPPADICPERPFSSFPKQKTVVSQNAVTGG